MSIDYDSGKINTLLYQKEDWGEIQSWIQDPGKKSLVVRLDSLGAMDCIASVLGAMADRALRLWPHWYGSGFFADSQSPSLDARLHSFLAALELCRRNRSIEPTWLKKAIQLAAVGKPPLMGDLAGEIQVRQLALALTNNLAGVTLAVSQNLRNARNCYGLPRMVEWLARESGLDVTVLLPRDMAVNEDLAPLLYNATSWRNNNLREKDGITAGGSVVPPPAALPPPVRTPDENAPDEERTVGAPHPRSKGEQLLAQRLIRDPQLAGLFGHNQPVRTKRGDTYIVDLLWLAGKVVVEIDGYYYHSNTIAFAADRDRDYRLHASGYRVLRLTHDEVVRDTELALEKIRDMVNFVQQSGSEANNVR